MKAIFADSFHYLALLTSADPAHSFAIEEHDRPGRTIVTTEAVLLEVGDALCEPPDHDDFLALYETVRSDPRTKIIPLNRTLIERGIQLFRKRADKNWPLTDCISFVVMKDEGISEALTADHHFEQAGFKVLLKG
jgi:uncharacterized protein